MSGSLRPLARPALRLQGTAHFVCRQCILSTVGRRGIQVSSAPATEFPKPSGGDAFGSTAENARDDTDARFEVLGSPYSLLSVRLSASQKLFTRRGTLVSVAGKAENAQSTLTLLSPARRAPLGVPFLYQRITSTTPLTLLIGTRATSTTLFTLRLDGTTDWVVAQRQALLAWTGHTLTVSPQTETSLGLAHWGQSFVTGRGLVALAAPGYIYPVTLAAGEELIVHPSHVVAYAANKNKPQPFRFKTANDGAGAAVESAVRTAASAASGAVSAVGAVTTRLVHNLHLQTPAVTRLSNQASDAWTKLRDTGAYHAAVQALFALRTTLRRTFWGDRLFVHVRGPTTLLLSSRGVRVADVLTRDEVDTVAEAEPGVVSAAVEAATAPKATAPPTSPPTAPTAAPTTSTTTSTTTPPKTTAPETPARKKDETKEPPVAVHVAEAKADGKVAFTEAKDLKKFVR